MPRLQTHDIYTMLAAGATKTYVATDILDVYELNANGGAIVLLADMIFSYSGTPNLGSEFKFQYGGGVTSNTAGGITVSFFGTNLTDAQALLPLVITAYWNGATWEINIAKSDVNSIAATIVASGHGFVSTPTGTNPITYTGAVSLPVLNNVYVSKSGNDATGAAGRSDLPFLTIAAAVTAANVAYPARTQNARASIIVETGHYTDTITLFDFLDFYLGSSVITASNGNRCVFDNTGTFVATTNNVPNCIIYGNATLRNTQASLATVELRAANIKVLIHCSTIYGEVFEAILMRTGHLKVYADIIYNANTVLNSTQTINLASDVSYATAPILEVFNAKIYTNPSGSVNSVIEIYSGIVGSEQPLYSKVMLVNCEVGSWSTTRAAINCFFSGLSVTKAQVTLRNVLIHATTTASISSEFAGNANNILYIYAYNVYVNLAELLGGATSAIKAGVISVDADVVVNQGETL